MTDNISRTDTTRAKEMLRSVPGRPTEGDHAMKLAFVAVTVFLVAVAVLVVYGGMKIIDAVM